MEHQNQTLNFYVYGMLMYCNLAIQLCTHCKLYQVLDSNFRKKNGSSVLSTHLRTFKTEYCYIYRNILNNSKSTDLPLSFCRSLRQDDYWFPVVHGIAIFHGFVILWHVWGQGWPASYECTVPASCHPQLPVSLLPWDPRYTFSSLFFRLVPKMSFIFPYTVNGALLSSNFLLSCTATLEVTITGFSLFTIVSVLPRVSSECQWYKCHC